MAFILHVDYVANSEKSAKAVLDALHIITEHQLTAPHPSVISYVFSQDSSNPLLLHFLEIYANEAVFWAHAADPSLQPAYLVTFTNRKWMQINCTFDITLADLDSKVKDCMKIFRNESISKVAVGSVLPPSPLPTIPSPNAIVFTWQFDAKSPDVLATLSKLNERRRMVQNDLICFEATERPYRRVSTEEPVPSFELVALYRNPSALIEHFTDAGKPSQLVTDLGVLVSSTSSVVNELRVYGAANEQVLSILSALTKTVKHLPTSEGYVLHPQAKF